MLYFETSWVVSDISPTYKYHHWSLGEKTELCFLSMYYTLTQIRCDHQKRKKKKKKNRILDKSLGSITISEERGTLGDLTHWLLRVPKEIVDPCTGHSSKNGWHKVYPYSFVLSVHNSRPQGSCWVHWCSSEWSVKYSFTSKWVSSLTLAFEKVQQLGFIERNVP